MEDWWTKAKASLLDEPSFGGHLIQRRYPRWRRRSRYAEYRQQMVDLVRSGRNQLAREFAVSAVDPELGRPGGPGRGSPKGARRRSVRSCAVCAGKSPAAGRADPEKQRPGSLGRRNRGVFRFMRAHRAEFRVTTMARVLGVSTSGFYGLKRPRRPGRSRTPLSPSGCGRFTPEGPTRMELADCGFAVSQARCQDAESGLAGMPPQADDDPSRRLGSPGAGVGSSWLRPRTTAHLTLAGFVYLSIVLRIQSIVGWAMNSSLATGLVLSALEMAIAQRRPECVIHHSDQGSQYRRSGTAADRTLDGFRRRLLRQRHGRELLRQPRVRAARQTTFRNHAAKAELFRRAQYPSSPFRDRNAHPSTSKRRTERPPDSLNTNCPRNRGNSRRMSPQRTRSNNSAGGRKEQKAQQRRTARRVLVPRRPRLIPGWTPQAGI